MLNAEPNAAHFALSELTEMGVLKSIITQNIDGLHQRAASGVVHEVHGNVRRVVCIRCFETAPAERFIRKLVDSGDVPRCEVCNGVMKPDAILFGEQLPAREVMAAQHTRMAARFDANSGTHVGDELEAAVTVANAHFFDPETGLSIRG